MDTPMYRSPEFAARFAAFRGGARTNPEEGTVRFVRSPAPSDDIAAAEHAQTASASDVDGEGGALNSGADC